VKAAADMDARLGRREAATFTKFAVHAVPPIGEWASVRSLTIVSIAGAIPLASASSVNVVVQPKHNDSTRLPTVKPIIAGLAPQRSHAPIGAHKPSGYW